MLSEILTATKVNAAAILAFGALIVIQIAIGVTDYPTIPPGLVISLAVVAVVVLAYRWRCSSLAGLLWPIFLLVGAALAPQTADHLARPDDTLIFVSSVLQLVVLGIALAAGAVAVVQRFRPPHRNW